jgi:hypothetical protein
VKLLQNAILITILVLCALWYWKANVSDVLPLQADASDFMHYHRAARDIALGHSPFGGPDFNYPPLIAFLLVPLAPLDYAQARWVWFLLLHAALLAAAWVTFRAAGGDRPAAVCVAVVWALGGAASENLQQGQIGPVLALLLVLSYARRGPVRGLWLGIGFALKFIPGVLSAALLLRRDWRALGALAATALSLVVLPWLAIRQMPGASMPARMDYWAGTPAFLNWSVPAVVLRAMDPPHPGQPLPYAWEHGNYTPSLRLTRNQRAGSVVAAALTLVAGLGCLLMACRGRLNAEQLPWAMAALTALGLAASPVAWTHYQVMQYPGVAWLLTSAIRPRRWGLAIGTLVCAGLLYPLPVALLRAWYHAPGGWPALSPATLYLWTSITAVACLGLYGLLLLQVRRAATPSC